MPDGRAEIMPDGPGFEWYRELAADGPRSRRYAHLPHVSLPRNGLPERPVPYVYRGTGDDVMAGQYGDPLLDGPDDF